MNLCTSLTTLPWIAVFGIVVVGGCGQNGQPTAKPDASGTGDATEQAGEFDPHDIPIAEKDVQRPADFADAVARIKAYRDDIETTSGGDTPGLAHRPLDELEFVLQWLPGIARDSGVPKEHWEAVNTAANEMRELFEKVHRNIDNKIDPDFAAVAGEIDAQIADLQTIAQAAPAGETND